MQRENKGLNIFNSAYVLADPKTATDVVTITVTPVIATLVLTCPTSQDFERILGVIGHEYFHNWSGNRVTVRDWFQLTLKEGLTVFRDQVHMHVCMYVCIAVCMYLSSPTVYLTIHYWRVKLKPLASLWCKSVSIYLCLYACMYVVVQFWPYESCGEENRGCAWIKKSAVCGRQRWKAFKHSPYIHIYTYIHTWCLT